MADPVADPASALPDLRGRAVVLFDGVCNFCSGSVRFVAPRDPAGRFAFAALQSPVGRALQERFGLPADALDTIVLVENERVWVKSAAIARILRGLSGLWPVLGVLLGLVPRPLRDFGYDQFAARRYAWFGRSEACLVPTPELRERLL